MPDGELLGPVGGKADKDGIPPRYTCLTATKKSDTFDSCITGGLDENLTPIVVVDGRRSSLENDETGQETHLGRLVSATPVVS